MVVEADKAKGGMGIRQFRVHLEGLGRGFLGFREGDLWSHHGKQAKKRVAIRDPRIRLRVRRVQRNRLLKIRQALLQTLGGSLVPEETALHIGLISSAILGCSLCE